MIMNDPLESIWKGTVLTRFRIMSRHLPGGSEETHAKHEGIRCPRPAAFWTRHLPYANREHSTWINL